MEKQVEHSGILKLSAAFLLVLVFLLAVGCTGALAAPPPADVAPDACGDSLTWAVSTDGVLTISGSGQMYDYGLNGNGATAPWGTQVTSVVFDGDITSIGSYAFAGTGITSISLPNSIEALGEGVFKNCMSLTSVTLPAGLVALQESTFENCTSLPSIDLPATLVTIGTKAFQNTNLGSLTLPLSVRAIGSYAFHYTAFSSVVLPDAGTTLSTQAFDSSVRVTSDAATREWVYQIYGNNITVVNWNGTATALTVPDTLNTLQVTKFGNRAFYGKTGLRSVVLPNNTIQLGTELFRGCTSLESASLGRNSTVLPQQCFFACRSLTYVELPQILTTIGEYAFGNCTALPSVEIPGPVETIGANAFKGCSNMTEVTILGDNALLTVGNSAFENCNSLVSMTFPDCLTTLGSNVFAGCSALSSVSLGYNLTNIEANTFQGLPSLKNVEMRCEHVYISPYAFSNCPALQSVTISNAVVGSGAFENCTGLRTFVMNGGSFEGPAFNSCQMLETLTLGSLVTTIPSSGFASLTSLRTVKLLGVNDIPSSAFDGCTALTDLTLGSNVTSVGDYAFRYCNSLADFELPSTLTNIGSYAFEGCNSLTEIRIPNAVTTINSGAFQNCEGLTDITLGSSVSSIGMSAFSGCTGLTEVNIPYGVQSIDSDAFAGCSSLARANLADSVEYVGSGAFPSTTRVYCDPSSQAAISISSNGGSFVAPDNDMFGIRLLLDGDISLGLSVEQIWAETSSVVIPEYIGGEMVTEIGRSALLSCPEVTDVTLPASVPVIPDGLCMGNNSLVSVTIPEGVTTIGAEAFANCSRLTTVSIPDSIAVIGARAFEGCGLLTEVTLSSHIQEIGENAFPSTKVYTPLGSDTAKMLSRTGGGFVCSDYPLLNLKYLFVGGEAVSLEVIGADDSAVSLTLPADVTSIAPHAFENKTKLTSITLSDSLVSIGESAFAGSGITSITLPAEITTIQDYTFQNTTALKSISVQGVVTNIGRYAFHGSGLLTASFPEGLTVVGNAAFADCASLTSVSLPDSVTSLGTSNLYADSVGVFQNSWNLSSFRVPAGVTRLDPYTFSGCYSLTTVTLPDGLEAIEDYAFNGSGLSSVDIPSSVKTIGEYAFAECKSLVEVAMAGDMDSIGFGAFYNCTALENLTMPDTLKTLGNNVFQNDRKLHEVILPRGLNTISSGAFEECDALTHVKVGDGTVLIDYAAFRGCDNLVSVELPTSLSRIGSCAFQYAAITDITIPNGVTAIESEAFYSCTHLRSITLPDSVVELGTNVFVSCNALETVHLSSSLVSLPDSIFAYCQRLTSVSLPDGLRAIAANAFLENRGLTAVLIPASVTSIDDTAFQYIEPSQLTVYCYHDTVAESFAQSKGYQIIYLNGDNVLAGLTIEPAQPGEEINLGIGHNYYELTTRFVIKPENTPYTPTIVYTVEDSNIAEVSINNVLTGLSVGDTSIVASLAANPEIKAEIPLHVRENITDFTLPSEIWQRRDETLTLLPETTVPAGANDGYVWSIDRALGTIAGNVLTPTAFGTGTLTSVSWNGIERNATIHIYDDPSRISFTNVPAGMDVDDSFKLNALVKAGALFNGDEALHFITYTSSDDSIATVDAQGTVTAVGYGSTTIVATADNGVTGIANIHVSAHITDFKLQGRILAPVGAVIDLSATDIEPANANPNALTWTSVPPGLVEYSNGQVTVLTDQECEVTITATTWDGALSRETKLTIYRPEVEEIHIQPVNQWNYVPPDSNVQLTALVKATEMFTNQLITWSIEYSDSSSVSIDQNGILHTPWIWHNITVKAEAPNGVSDSIALYVAEPTTGFDLPVRYAIQTGDTVTVMPTNVTGADNAFSLSVGNQTIASVDGMEIQGLKPGKTTLTVTSWDGMERTAEVLVYDPIQTVTIDQIESKNSQVSASNPMTDLFVQMNYQAHTSAVSDTATYKDDLLTWTSSNPTIIRVDPVTGEFRTINYGTATLTATAVSGVKESIELHVRNEVRNFRLPTEITAYVLADQTLEVSSLDPEDAYTGFVWSVSPESLGTVDGNVLHVLSDVPASGTITATSWDGYVTRETTLTIIQQPVSSISLDPYGDGETGVGGDYALTAHVIAGTDYVNEFVNWSSSDESIATVNDEGVVHVLNSGEYTITATAADNPEISDSITLIGVQGIENFTVSPKELRVYTGESLPITITDIQPANAIVRDFTYSITPEEVATVEDGEIRPLTIDNADAVLTVRSWNGVTKEYPIHIVQPVIQRFEFDDFSKMSVGESRQINTRVWVDDTMYENRFVSWYVTDSNIASIDENGVLTGLSNGSTRVVMYNSQTGEPLADQDVFVALELESFDVYCTNEGVPIPDTTEASFYYTNINPSDSNINLSWAVEFNNEPYEFTLNSEGGINVTPPDFEGVLTVTAKNINGISASTSVRVYYTNVYELTTDMDENNENARTVFVPLGSTDVLPVSLWRNGYRPDGEQVPVEKLYLDCTSDNADVATVDHYGNVTGVSKGKATITVRHDSSGHEIRIPVQVVESVENFDLPGRISIPCGTEKEIPLQNLTPTSVTADDLFWSIEPSDAAVIRDGKIVALATHDTEATITATSVNGITRTATLVLYTPWVDRIELEPMPYAPSGQSVQFTAHVWADGIEYVNKFVTFGCYWNQELTDEPGYVQDSINGIIACWSDQATLYISATAESGVQDVIEVQFKPEYEDFQPDVLFLNPNSVDYISFASYQATNGSGFNPNGNNYLLYVCDSEAIHVDNYGNVQAGSEKGVFPVTISSVNGVTKQTQVVVYENEDINGMRIEAVPEHNPVYKTIQLNALVSIFGEELPGNQFVTWESDNSSVATVNSNGAVRTLGYGSAVITATDVNGNTDSVTINVLQAPDNFTLPTTFTVQYGQSVTVDAESVAPEDAVLDLVWSVEPEGIVSIEGNVLTPLVNEDFIATLTAVNWDGTTRSTLLDIQRDLRALPAFTLPAMLTDIEEEAFAGISAQHVVLPFVCNNIGSRAFADSSELLLVEIPSGTGNIADDAFEGCEGLTILAPAGSDAQLYAENHGMNFLAD